MITLDHHFHVFINIGVVARGKTQKPPALNILILYLLGLLRGLLHNIILAYFYSMSIFTIKHDINTIKVIYVVSSDR